MKKKELTVQLWQLALNAASSLRKPRFFQPNLVLFSQLILISAPRRECCLLLKIWEYPPGALISPYQADGREIVYKRDGGSQDFATLKRHNLETSLGIIKFRWYFATGEGVCIY